MTWRAGMEIFLWAVTAAVSIPILVLFVECVAALWPRRGRPPVPAGAGPRLAVVLPAHNEEAGLAGTLRSLRPQLEAGDRILVIADNCSDRTAEVARSEGAEVLERRDAERRGKGYALAHGLTHLSAQPPEMILFVDADTRVDPGSVRTLRDSAWATAHPAQAVYLMDAPERPRRTDVISSFAFLTKNLTRPAGLARLGIPCHLLGTGMAIPWKLIDIQRLATGNIVEDMQLGIDLAIAGSPPHFCLDARVRGELPSAQKAALLQRTRWEHGHLGTLLTQSPRLAWQSLRQARPALLGMALDLAVPPLAFLSIVWSLAVLADLLGAWRRLAGLGPSWAAGGAGALLLGSVLLSWGRHARGYIPGRALLLAPLYILWKVPLYAAFLFRRQREWVRTPRESASGSVPKDPSGSGAA